MTRKRATPPTTSAASRLDGRTLEDFVIEEGMKRVEALLGASEHALRVLLRDPVADAVRKKILALSDHEREAMRVELASWKRVRERVRAVRRKQP